MTEQSLRELIERWRTEVGCNPQSPDDSKQMWFETGKNHAMMNCARELEELTGKMELASMILNPPRKRE